MVGNNVYLEIHPSQGVQNRMVGWGASLLADKGNLLLLLYDKAMRCMEEAIVLIEAGDMIGKGKELIQAQDIVLQLADALVRDSDDENATAIALNLERLYLYIYRRLIRGNDRLDKDAIREARRLMNNLYQAWEQIILDTTSAIAPMQARA